MSTQIRLVVADDHPIVRKGLVDLIGSVDDMRVVGEAANGAEAVDRVVETAPDVVLIDLVMPKKDGIQAIGEIHGLRPEARILVLTSFSDDDKVFAAIKAGALGYLLKDASPEELLSAIRNVYAGESSLHPRIALKVIGELNRDKAPAKGGPDALTERELEVLGVLAQGLSNQEISDRLFISPKTTGKHVSNILLKLHLANRTQAALYAIGQGESSG
ncbi:MAG: response regulator transcription factor [Spirochaetes bacterium]|nr:response regulator transcription factor [Spirochaetota bacterium]MBU1078851.1 response regulator transcription factor [Spirochaetota bacterium]